MSLKHIENVISNCSVDHTIKEAYLNFNNVFWVKIFLSHLDETLETLYKTNSHAYKDFVNNKLPAVSKNSFDKHSLISALCELCIMNTFIVQSDDLESFVYEPKLRIDNNKNVEFSICIRGVVYNVEVKSPNLEKYYTNLSTKIEEYEVVTRFDTRSFGKPKESNQMPSPSIRVKDFLVDANAKFPMSDFPKKVNVLFIAWDDNTDQPCIEMKHPMHGILTPHTWYKDSNNNPVTFPNIDLIFISDLYQNIIAHLSSGEMALPSIITGVPYFERNSRWKPHKLNPFYLAFSRNVLIKPDVDISDPKAERSIFNIPIAFLDQSVEVVDEKYVSRYGIDVKYSFKI